MITPVQQTPIPLDPIRQQITPTLPIEPPPPPRPADTPVQPGDSTQDNFSSRDGDGKNRRGQALDDQQKAETANKLRNAYLRLKDLKREADAAAASGNAALARDLAAEAANVASTIPASVGIMGQGPAATSESAKPFVASAGGPSPAKDETTTPDLPAVLDIARAGLGSAKETVDIAANVPTQPVADRIAINEMRQQVLTAMANVETIANQTSSSEPAPVTTGHIDLKA
ncbi:MAG: hypothetical protein F8N37_03690 [Telmatospirillum sp.]|nr:hypothetical protein [Telmatospirillum sp.]